MDINELSFEVPTKRGVFLLVGVNGVGKTTLLTAIDRIKNSYAFASGYSVSTHDKSIDQFKNTKIIYKCEDSEVEYTRREKRWVPLPRKNSHIVFNKFAFNSVIFVRANSDRISPTADEIKKGNSFSADNNLIDAMNQIFETDKFSNLRILRNGRGRGKIPAEFFVIKNRKEIYSEKRFSSGEIATLSLIKRVLDAKDKTLILLDETEMALHPRVQANLYDYLMKMTESKEITVIMSTHSSILIHKTNPQNIYLIDKDEKKRVEVINPCYPTRAIGQIEDIDSAGYDVLYFVEDYLAKLVLTSMIENYMDLGNKRFRYRVIPVGGFLETAKLTIETSRALITKSKVYCFLDEDAFSDDYFRNKKFKELIDQDDNKKRILNLTVVPELWLVDIIEKNKGYIQNFMKEEFYFDFRDLKKDEDYLLKGMEFNKQEGNKNLRRLAKNKFEIIIRKLTYCSAKSDNSVQEILIDFCVKNDIGTKVYSLISPTVKR